jgi:uncharacterized repeat protein (TIGR01451 family)
MRRKPAKALVGVFVLIGLLTIVVTAVMANNLTGASASVSCTGFNLSVTTTDGSLNANETYTVVYTFTSNCTAVSNSGGSFAYTADANGNATGGQAKNWSGGGALSANCTVTGTANLYDSSGNLDSTLPITISGSLGGCGATPSLAVTKTADFATVTPGSTAGFTVTISNTGSAAATGVTLSDPLPAGAGSDINWMIDTTTGNPNSFNINGSVGSQVLVFNPSSITLGAGASLTVHITGLTSVSDETTSSNPALSVGGVSGYTVLYEGIGGHNLQITNVSIGGNIGVGGTGHVQFSGPGTIGGRLDFSAANTGQYSNNNGSNVGPTSVNYNVTAVTTALNEIGSLSTSLGGLAGTSIKFNNANQTVNESSGTLQTSGGITYRVFNVTSYSENNGDVVTIVGDGSGNPVVFNFGFNNNVNLGGDVVLTGGLTPDQVIWNFASSNQNIQLNNNASSYPYPSAYQGVILAPNDKISVVNSSLIGRVFGGDSGDMQIVSGDNIHTPPGGGSLLNTATVSATSVSSVSATATITIK